MGDLNLKFNLKSDASQAKAEILDFSKSATTAFERIALSSAGLTGSLGTLAIALGPVGVGFGLVTGAVSLTVGAIASLVKTADEYLNRLHIMSERTGTSVEALSALALPAKQLDLTLDDVAANLQRYDRLIGQAANGSEQARTKLTRLHVDWRQAVADNDYALAALFKRVNELPPGIQRVNAAQDAFGKSGAKMVELIEKAGGNFKKFMEEARQAGRVMSEEDAAAAHELSNKFDEITNSAHLTAVRIGKELLPEVSRALDDISAALGSNLGSWEDWGHSIAVIIARERGALEGLAKRLHSDDWYNLRKLGEAVSEGAEAGEMEETQRYIEEQVNRDKPKPKRPTTGGNYYGDGDKGKSKKDNSFKFAEGAIRLDEQEEVEQHREVTERFQREYNRRITDLDEYVSKSKEELETHYAIQSQDFDREEKLIRASVKNKQDQHLKILEVEAKRTAALRQYESDKTKIEDNAADEHEAARVARAEGLASVRDAVDRNSIARTQALVDAQFLTEAQGAAKIGDLQLATHDRAINLLSDRMAHVKKDSAEYRTIQGQIAAGEVVRAGIQEETARRIEAANRREVESAVERYQALRAIDEQLKLDEFQISRSEIEAAGRVRGSSRVAIIRARTKNAEDAERERHKQVMDSLQRQEEEKNEQATTLEELEEIAQNSHHARENEERRHQQEMGRIHDEGKAAEDEVNPFKGIQRDIKDAESVVTFSGKAIADTYFKMKDALGEAIAANILYGESIGKALKKALAEQLAAVASEAAIQSIKHAAWALGDLAFGDFSGAAKHAAAAAAFAGVAIAAGVGGSALAKSTGLKGASAGSGGSTASGTAINNTSPSYQFNYGGQASFPSSQVADDGSRGGLGGMIADAFQRVAATQAALAGQISRLNSMPPHQVVTLGAEDAHAAIGRAVIKEGNHNDAFNSERVRQHGWGR